MTLEGLEIRNWQSHFVSERAPEARRKGDPPTRPGTGNRFATGWVDRHAEVGSDEANQVRHPVVGWAARTVREVGSPQIADAIVRARSLLVIDTRAGNVKLRLPSETVRRTFAAWMEPRTAQKSLAAFDPAPAGPVVHATPPATSQHSAATITDGFIKCEPSIGPDLTREDAGLAGYESRNVVMHGGARMHSEYNAGGQ